MTYSYLWNIAALVYACFLQWNTPMSILQTCECLPLSYKKRKTQSVDFHSILLKNIIIIIIISSSSSSSSSSIRFVLH